MTAETGIKRDSPVMCMVSLTGDTESLTFCPIPVVRQHTTGGVYVQRWAARFDRQFSAEHFWGSSTSHHSFSTTSSLQCGSRKHNLQWAPTHLDF
jgi:hypothetical protein